ncbi:MAG: acetyl-CoA decarbonylase/synthase complex subunit gamma [Candidatus Omnitrophica bacterium]|nr:acetyl-CoA decarbonylase/synthase complex subunit gamma [Candidatus Omnitrophota bacterium]
MAFSGLDIYKLLPKTNCRECGFATCLAFAMQLAKKAVSIDKCPYLSPEAKKVLESSSLPPIKLITIGTGEQKLEIGNESVMFRHEEKFHRPCGLGFVIDDSLTDSEIKDKLARIAKLSFERVGQKLDVNLVALKQVKDAKRFTEAVKLVSGLTTLPIGLISEDSTALKDALITLKDKRALIYRATKENFTQIAPLAKEFKATLVASAPDLNSLSTLTQELNKLGIEEIMLDTGNKTISEKIWDLTQIRRLALKKSNRSLGFPAITLINKADPYEEAMEAASYICKYSGIILLRNIEAWQTLALLTLRQNIYTDPQKPLQIEPKLYPIGATNDKSPVLITTNFSLSYFTVLGEVEASKVPTYILSVDTEGMSVLTAWAAEKFTPDKISDTVNKLGVKETVSHNRLIIPGYVAMMSGELEEKSGWQIIVGPKEASGIPSFLRNL